MNIGVSILLLGIPVYIFSGELFIGGDDSRLLYSYPYEVLRQVAGSAWLHFSSIGTFTPNYFLIPLSGILWLLKTIVGGNPLIVAYVSYSAPLLIGFIYFRKFIRSLLQNNTSHEVELAIAGLLYVLSPIMIVNQLTNFLYSAWLIGLIPLLLYYWIKYQENGQLKYLVIASIWSVPLALALFSIPWLLGLLLPLGGGLIIMLTLERKVSFIALRRLAIFIGSLFLVQLFWLLPFLASLKGGLAAQAIGSETADTFAPTVLATSNGSIFYPLVNLFHRQIAFDFSWDLRHIFTSYYDTLAIFNIIFFVVLVAGIWLGRKYLSFEERRVQLMLAGALLVALFLFTVNIGPLKQIFLSMGELPGFAMFRNAFDKFALGYIFIYSCCLTLSIITLSRAGRSRPLLRRVFLGGVFILILLNAAPIKQIVDRPLWTTRDTKTTTTLPIEYTSFMQTVQKNVSSATNILSVPFGVSSYTVIPNKEGGSAYVGRSPVQLFSGVNDLSGNLSFTSDQAIYINELIKHRNYDQLNSFLRLNNINYLLLTKNIPPEILQSYLFDKDTLQAQDDTFLKAVTDGRVAESTNGNFILYKTKAPAALFSAPDTLISMNGDGNSKETSLTDAKTLMSTLTATSALVPSSISSNSVRKSYPLNVGKVTTLPVGTYTLNNNHQNIRVLKYDATTQKLIVTAELTYRLNGLTHYGPQTAAISLSPQSLLKVDNTIRQAKDFQNYSTDAASTMTIYSAPASNLIPKPATMLKQWQKGDCNNYESGNKAATNIINKLIGRDEVLDFSATVKHEACLYAAIPLKAQRGYILSFDYKTDTENDVMLSLDGKKHLVSTTASGDNEWRRFEYAFTGKNEDTVSPLYLYSGQDEKGVRTTYKNISLIPFQSSRDQPVDTRSVMLPTVGITKTNSEFTLAPDTTNETPALGRLADWEQGDCAAIADGLANPVSFQFQPGASYGLLRAKSGHNACLSQSLAVDADNVYALSFNYRSHATKGLVLAVGFQDSPTVKSYKLDGSTNGTWRHSEQTISLPPGTDRLRVFLYSGVSNDTGSVTEYKDISFTSYPANFQGAFAIQQSPAPPTPPPDIEFTHHNSFNNFISIKGATRPFLLSFAESFHPGWELYLKPLKGNGQCQQSVKYQSSTQIVECESRTTLMQQSGIDLISASPIFDDKHVKINGFNNGWTIDPEYIKANYPSEYYRVNADGSLDFNMIVYFQPQSYFYIGLGISMTTVLGGVVYLVTSYIRRRRRFMHHQYPGVTTLKRLVIRKNK